MNTTFPPSFATLLYRYWFFGWIFRDAARGSALERASALRHNVERARWLPTYIRRWTVLAASTYALGSALERLGFDVVATFAFVPTCLAAAVLAVAFATWWLLRGTRTSYLRRPAP